MTVVLDASAVLAALLQEPGGDAVEAALGDAVVGAVNVAEIATALVRFGNSAVQSRALLAALSLTTVPADHDLALDAGFLRALTDPVGLSLGDRFCLAVARRFAFPVLTADRSWRRIAAAVEVDVILIR